MGKLDQIQSLLDDCDYEPIEAYGVIGDCRSGALVSRSGSVDWLCVPHFGGPSVFAALLDRRRGGRFLIRPRDSVRIERRYLGRSAVLATTFHCSAGTLTLTDFMSVPGDEDESRRLFRFVSCEAGEVDVDVALQPRPDYARVLPKFESCGDSGWRCRQTDMPMTLYGDVALALDEESQTLGGTYRLRAGEQNHFVFAYGRGCENHETGFEHWQRDLERTLDWWDEWCSQTTYDGFHSDEVIRSCLTLKLLTYQPSGAVLAALTTSLPESLEAQRNWDYRYCWLRDTSLLLHSFTDLGFERESKAFLGWLLNVGLDPHLQPFYSLDAQPPPEEIVLTHLEGYRGCGPVRIGNEARHQLQLDIYGEVMQTACGYASSGSRLIDVKKHMLAALGKTVCKLWREPDHSIWEPRNAPRHYTYSKMMCWVALDRLLGLHQHDPLDIPVAELSEERERIRHEIETQGFNRDLDSYVGYFGGTEPDASLLLMAPYGYVDATDPRMQGTYRYIMEQLSSDGLLYRYPPGKDYDGIDGKENHFAACSFWAVDHLAFAGETDEAIKLFERLLERANDVGLYAEQFEVGTGLALGNFPQAFSHAGLITAALSIERALGGRRGHPSLCSDDGPLAP